MRNLSIIRITLDGGTSVANRTACLGTAPKIKRMFSHPASLSSSCHTSVAADEHYGFITSAEISHETAMRRTIPSFICRNQPKVLTLGLCTFTHTSAHASLDLMRRPNTFIPFLQRDCHFAQISAIFITSNFCTHSPPSHQSHTGTNSYPRNSSRS